MTQSGVAMSLLDLCSRATNLANSISVHIVEYLAASKTQTPYFKTLAVNFLEICQTLWPIQAGLLDASRAKDQLPAEITQELSKKMKQTIEDFTTLDILLIRLLTYEKKHGFTKFVKGLNMMSIDSEILSLSEAVAKDRDGLRMGSLAFKWVLGEANAHAVLGNTYTSLAKALRIEDSPITPKEYRNSQPQLTSNSAQRQPPTQPLPKIPSDALMKPTDFENFEQVHHKGAPQVTVDLPPLSRSTTSERHRKVKLPSSIGTPAFAGLEHLTSPQLDHIASHSTLVASTQRSSASQEAEVHGSSSDGSSVDEPEYVRDLEDMLRSADHDGSQSSMYRQSVISTGAKWTPRQVAQAGTAATKAALVAAVQRRNRKVLEELLDSGVAPDSVTEYHLLSQAVLNSDPASVRLLLLFGADANRLSDNGITALWAATDMSSLEMVKLLLKHGADPTICAGPDQESPLALSARMCKMDILRTYVRQGVDVNVPVTNGDTVLIKSINGEVKEELVELLLKSGANANGKTRAGKTALFEAIMLRRIDLVTLLLHHGANPNLAGPKHPLWPASYEPAILALLLDHGAKSKMAPGVMELATSTNSLESVNILLRAGVSPNIKKDGVYTPLCSSIRDDRADIFAVLLKHGADPNLPASEYPTFKCITHDRLHFLPDLIAAGANLNEPSGILETAVAHNSNEAVMYLMKHGVDINARSPEGHTPLTTAIRENREHLVKLLLSHGASPLTRGEDWPLCMAVKQPNILKRLLAVVSDPGSIAKGIVELAVQANNMESIKLLLKAGVNVEDKTGGVFSPLTTAIREHRKEITRYLLDEAGADINAPGEHLPIIKALRRNTGPEDTEMIEILLERGADINLIYRGWNAVMQAVENGEPVILQLLIEKGNGIDLQVVDPETDTAVIDFVRKRGWQEGADMLLENQHQTRMITASVD